MPKTGKTATKIDGRRKRACGERRPFGGLQSGDAIDPFAASILRRHDGQAEHFLERSGERAAHCVRLLAGGFPDLLDRRAIVTLQHLDDCGLLAVLAGAGLGDLPFILRPLGLSGRHGGLCVGVRGNGRGHLAFAPNGCVGGIGQVVLDVVGVLKLGDQVASEQAIDDGGFCTAAQVGRQRFNIAIRASGGF